MAVLQSELKKSQIQSDQFKKELLQNQKRTEQLENKSKENLNNIIQKDRKLKEITLLYNNLREVITQQKEGFEQTMYSYQRKYKELVKTFSTKETELETKLTGLQNHTTELQKTVNEKEKEIESLTLQYNKAAHSLQQDMEGAKTYSKELEKEIENLKKSQQASLQEKEMLWENKTKEEILKYKTDYENLKIGSKKELAQLKNQYETQMEKLCSAHEKKIRHISTEMENDLLSEIKRAETLKTIKNRRIEELEIGLKSLQQEVYKMRTETLGLKKATTLSEENLKKEILKTAELENQNKNLKSLWEELQQQVEKKNQQVSALQKLNRDLSFLFNEKKAEPSPTISNEKENPKPSVSL